MNTEQRDGFLQLMKKQFPNGCINGYDTTTKWENISEALNKLGPEKTIDECRQYWIDLKTATQAKLDLVRSHRQLNGSSELPPDISLIEEDLIVIDISKIAALEADPDIEELRRRLISIELVRQLDCGAISPFDPHEETENEPFGKMEDVEVHENFTSTSLEDHIIELLKTQNEAVQQVLYQQKEANECLEQIKNEKCEKGQILEEQLEEQKQINSRLVDLMTALTNKLQL